ncbi:PAS domain S-box protein [Hydrogenophaga sp. PAMC20947]|uniref:PAS domain-containing sensor histidine kinase n=1 Tax=Hydrogenophaga sp. PAMC20947 TaxID=2565558 RepID=UPI00109E34DB|nr:PAS domain S-box protein [Hydrogenophaga sp. PAMC20947]QCB47184.1 PAS domain S-box protein [Hydrogenophaga sp. PAMC20947]
MSAYRPLQTPNDAPGEGQAALRARMQAMEQELETLRQENQHLRRHYASHLDSIEGALRAELPRTLPPKVHAFEGKGDQALASQLDYEALLAAMSSVFPIGIFRTDANGVLTHIDGSLQRIFELAPSEFQNYGWFQRVHPEDVDSVKKAWADGILNGTPLSLEFRLLYPDGRIAHVLARNSPVLGEQGQLEAQHGFLQDISSLRALQAEARIKDELNRQIIASSPDCTKVLDLQGHVVQMTAQGCRLMEVDDFEQVRGSEWSTWWKGESHTMAREAIEAAVKGKSARFVAAGETFKGTPRWWDTVVTPISGVDGQPVMLMAVTRDVTDLYQHQEEIQTLNASLEDRVVERTQALADANRQISDALEMAQRLYNQAPCGYHSIDAQGVIIRINQTELDWFGFTLDEVVGKRNVREWIRPDQVPGTMERLERLMRKDTLEPAEVCMVRRDGREFWVLIGSTAVYDEHGVFLHTNNTLVDISGRHAAEAALASQRSFLQTITNSVPVQIAFFDHEMICRFANASYARWLGGDPQNLLGKHLSEIAHPENYQQGLPFLKAALAGTSQRFEGERVFPDGQTFYATVEYTPFIENGETQGIFIQMLDISERREAEMRVTAANQQLSKALSLSQNLYNEAPCGYHSLDVNGVYVSINDIELRWLGYTREEVVGHKSFRDFILPSRETLLEDRLNRLVHDGVLENAEYEMQCRDGSTFPALLSSSAVRDAQGRFVRSNTTVIDISARKAAETALRENQRFLHTIANQIPGIVAYLDTQLRYRFANVEHTRIYGLDSEAMIGLHIRECMPEEIWPDIEPRLNAALGGEIQRYEAWRKNVAGETMYVRASYLPDIHNGVVQGLFIQGIDITETKQVEERISHLNDELETRIQERSVELLESEQRFRLMVDNLRDYCIFFLDAQGVITDWTDSAQRMEGYSPTEVVGRHYHTLFRRKKPDEALASAERMLRIATSRGQHELHAWHERKDGSRYWSYSVLIALRDDTGELRGFAKINQDMSDAKRLDDLMRNINEELENRVSERTEQLLAANKDLESFSYSVSHDLRSPLRHISSFVSLLEEHLAERGDETTQRYLSTIATSARHMSQLIDGLLAFSRLGRSAVSLAPVDFSMLVDAVVNQIDHDTQGRVVDWVIAPDLPVVQGDALLLREVWANLLGNAFKYTRPRERTRIEVTWSVDPAVGYTFSVADNGVGFDMQYAQKLFGVFQRMHRASEFEGTGIGLALTRRILERHGGSIWAESEIHHGSIFHFSLPFDGVSLGGLPHDT